MATNFELRLIGANAGDGEISLAHLAAIAASLQELSTRLVRSWDGAERPGRSRGLVDELADITLTGVGSGSTRLELRRGPDSLDVSVADLEQVDDRFWALIRAIGEDERPGWTTDLVADSVVRFIEAIRAAARGVGVTREGEPWVEFATAAVHVDTWVRDRGLGTSAVAVTGVLEKVDLHSHDFRIRDDVGKAIPLHRVADDRDAAALVGRRVIARGVAPAAAGPVTVVWDVHLVPDDSGLAELRVPEAQDLTALLASAPGPDRRDALDLDHGELVDLLAAANE